MYVWSVSFYHLEHRQAGHLTSRKSFESADACSACMLLTFLASEVASWPQNTPAQAMLARWKKCIPHAKPGRKGHIIPDSLTGATRRESGTFRRDSGSSHPPPCFRSTQSVRHSRLLSLRIHSPSPFQTSRRLSSPGPGPAPVQDPPGLLRDFRRPQPLRVPAERVEPSPEVF